MRIAYLTSYDVLDSSKWPKNQVGLCGAGYYLAKTLESQSTPLDYVGSLKQIKPSLKHKLKWHLNQKLFKKDYFYFLEPSVLEAYSAQVLPKLAKFNSNVVLCPENAIPLAYLECQQPIVLWTDAPLSASINFYPWLSNLTQETFNHLLAMEKLAFEKCQLLIFLSDWAAQTAIETYGINPAKVVVIPWGANIETNRNNEDIHNIVEAKNNKCCKLLFIGVDWFRKGGDIAFEIAKELNSRGIETELSVLGCEPEIEVPLPKYVKTLGFISKYTREGLNKINQLFTDSHFLVLPSRADFSPHVFCEANSFGLPCIGTQVGGIPTLIKHDFNGKTFSLRASISEYCNYIATLMNNYSDYKTLAYSSFNEYQSRLNWSVAGQTAKKIIEGIL
ncbi:MAG: glycosyltransferase family 4 protein [Chroococcus sp. CMT-3BRIN-NPC107]|jgi:glycosyltransferase involved in cell wall biosynthesis|nr:glycosyltransferase family 4 protein [Chroococcus sp. CMT-3BRIN-NPC107]